MTEPATVYDAIGLHSRGKHEIRTYTGRHVDPFVMTTRDVHHRDIAHALSHACRFGGHSEGHLSVARHSIHVMQWLERHEATVQECLAGLLHDAAEAYIGDMVRPLKHRDEFQLYRALDDRVTAIILKHFHLPFTELPTIVHEADVAITNVEVNHLRFSWDSRWQDDKQEYLDALHRYNSAHNGGSLRA